MLRNLWVNLIAVALIVASATIGFSQASNPSHTVTKADIEKWSTELSNWGRWGKDDQIGALNLITPEKRKQAAKLVKDGISVSLARTAMLEKAVDNPDPYVVEWYASPNGPTAFDRFSVTYHGSAHTHLDGLDHHYDVGGKGYNGYEFDRSVATSKTGHPRNTILNVKNGIFTRGILIDIPRLKGVPYLEPGTPIYIEDIEAWEKKAGVKVSAGDALFIRTGRWARRAAVGPWDVSKLEAGLDPSVIPWLRKRDIATLGGEVPQSVKAPNLPDLGPMGNVHAFTLSVLGIHLFDNCDLDALAEVAAAHNRWEFLLTAAPIPFPGGTGSPINPIATF
jgi:kynurenine formamidase